MQFLLKIGRKQARFSFLITTAAITRYLFVDENNFFESEGSENKFLNADERKDFIQKFNQKEKKEKDQGSFRSQTKKKSKDKKKESQDDKKKDSQEDKKHESQEVYREYNALWEKKRH